MATVLKGKMVAGNMARPCRFNLSDVREEGRVLVEQARAEADAIRQQARVEAETIREQAQQAGHQQGFEQGLQQGRQQGRQEALEQAQQQFAQQAGQLTSALEQLLSQFDESKRRAMAQAQQELLAVAVTIAGKIVAAIAGKVPNVAAEAVRRAVSIVSDGTDVRVHLSPQDYRMLETLDPRAQQRWMGRDHVKFVADESVQPGGCVVKTAAGQIDAQLATQIHRIVEQLLPGLCERVKRDLGAAAKPAERREG